MTSKKRRTKQKDSSRAKRRTEALLLFVAYVLTVACHLLVELAQDDKISKDTYILVGVMAVCFLVAHIAMRRLAPNASPIFLPVAGLLAGIGFAMVSRLTPAQSATQGMWLIVGISAFCITLFLLRDYRILDRYRYIAMACGVVLLLLPLAPVIGHAVNGSNLWIKLGPLTFQPGELAKICLVIFFASYLNEKRELLAIPTRKLGPIAVPDIKYFGPLLSIWGLSLIVMFLEKDLGSSLLVFSIFLAMLYIATARIIYVLVGLALISFGASFAYSVFGHVQKRVSGWLDTFNPATIHDQTFQLAQALFAFAGGGIFGTGLGLGRPELIPAAATDFIFAAIGEELGFIGVAAIVLLFVILVGSGFRTGLRCSDQFGKLLAAGLAAALGFQAFIIMGGVTRLIPLTGITLPFMSYGGSSIFSNFIILAIFVAISDQQISGPRGVGLGRKPRMLNIGEKVAKVGATA